MIILFIFAPCLTNLITFMIKEKLLIQNTGLGYDLLNRGVVLCSFPTLRLAMHRAHEIINELGLSHEVVFIGHV